MQSDRIKSAVTIPSREPSRRETVSHVSNSTNACATSSHVVSGRAHILRRPHDGKVGKNAIAVAQPSRRTAQQAQPAKISRTPASHLLDIEPMVRRSNTDLNESNSTPRGLIASTNEALRVLFIPSAAVVVLSGLLLLTFGPRWDSKTDDLELAQIELADATAATSGSSTLFADVEAPKDSRTLLDSIHASLSSALAEISTPKAESTSRTTSGESLEELRSKVKFISGLIAMHRPTIPNCGEVAKAIVEIGVRENVDPFFIAAVISIESRFVHSAVSKVGARGLMQLMPETASDVAKRTRATAGAGSLHDTKTNITLGVRYLKQLLARYRGDASLTLAAYNWGPGNVDKARKGEKRIPGSVMNYSKTVQERSKNWSQHYRRAAESASTIESIAYSR